MTHVLGKLHECAPGEKIRLAHADDDLIVLEAGEGIEETINSGELIPVVSVETWKVVLEAADENVFSPKEGNEHA